ncbi:hypothetical protein phiV208_19 [Vibrio phage phiV208]|nr:hypothetical protein phiV208_19 [Vibrio phage phiV208]
MITCKEDLINTYVKNTPELRREFLSLAVKFGLIDSKSEIGESSEEAVVAYWNDVTGDNPKVGCWFAYADQIKEECRELTLSDLKPRTKVEYEKVTESIFDLKGEFKLGVLYCGHDGSYVPVSVDSFLADCYSQGKLYRKVERPVEWWEDAVEYIRSLNGEANAIDFTDASSDGKKMAMNISVVLDERQAKDFARILLEQEGE